MPHRFGIVGIPKRGGGPLVKPAPGAIINPQHPLAQGMAYCNLLRGLTGADECKRQSYTTSNLSLSAYGGMQCLSASGTAGAAILGSANNIISETGSLSAFVVFQQNAQDYAQPVSIYRSGTSILGLWLDKRVANPRVEWMCKREGGARSAASVWNHSTNIHTSAFSFQAGAVAGTTYIDGSAGTGASVSAGDNVGADARLFSRSSAVYYYLNGRIFLFITWTRALNPTEIAKLHAEPYSMFWLPGVKKIFLGAKIPAIIFSRGVTSFNIGKNKKNKNFQKMAISW